MPDIANIAVNTINDAVGGAWKHTLFQPAFITKWAFSCRPTVLTLGMVTTQRTEGMFGVAKVTVLEKNLSLCALWEKLQRLYKMLDIEAAR